MFRQFSVANNRMEHLLRYMLVFPPSTPLKEYLTTGSLKNDVKISSWESHFFRGLFFRCWPLVFSGGVYLSPYFLEVFYGRTTFYGYNMQSIDNKHIKMFLCERSQEFFSKSLLTSRSIWIKWLQI